MLKKPQKLLVTKTVSVSHESGVLTFEEGKTFDDPGLVGMIIEHNIPHFRISDDVPGDALPASPTPAHTHN